MGPGVQQIPGKLIRMPFQILKIGSSIPANFEREPLHEPVLDHGKPVPAEIEPPWEFPRPPYYLAKC